MSDNDYFARRAEQEVELAQQANNPAAVAAHYRLSTAYLEKLLALMPANDRADTE